jgi:transcriptional regulator with XRE-family HTH domain
MTGPEFKSTRVSLGLSQSDMGRIIRKSERTIRRYEKGDLPILEDVAAAADELSRQFTTSSRTSSPSALGRTAQAS